MSRKLQEGFLTPEILESLHACGKMDVNLHYETEKSQEIRRFIYIDFIVKGFFKMLLQALHVKVLLDRVSYSVVLPNPRTGFLKSPVAKGCLWRQKITISVFARYSRLLRDQVFRLFPRRHTISDMPDCYYIL
jgi:hypothetical protein